MWQERPGHTPFSPQDSYLNVQLVGWIDSVGEIEGLVASEDGKAIYVNTDSTGLVVVNISDPANPYIYRVIRHDSLSWIGPVARVDTFLYVWWSDWFSRVPLTYVHEWDAYNISNPLNPVFVKTIYHYEGPETKPPWRWCGAVPPDGIHDTIFTSRLDSGPLT